MARRRSYRYNLPRTVADIVQAVCADYTRRENAIKYSAITGPTLARYVELNAAIDTALEGVEAGIREELLRDIGHGKGYENSMIAPLMAKNTYYIRKRKVVLDIARGLSLV
jgi:hypothetical protein